MPRKRWLIPAIGVTVLAAAAIVAATNADAAVAPAAAPAPAGVTAADEINYLKSITGDHVLSGAEGGANTAPAQWNQKADDITGKWPALWGGDFGFSQSDINARQTVINEAKAEWAAGSIPALMMHSCRPDVATCDFSDGANPVQGSTLSNAEWTQLITDGSPLNNDYKRKLDQFVPYFQQLKDAGIPVLFRPLHEMNEGWAWWGGRPGASGDARLYQITHDYLESKGLTNIIWVWALKDVAGGTSAAAGYYPGADYVDVVGLDVWVNRFPSTDWYQAMQNIAGTRPIALAEVGSVPSPAQLASQPRWAYWSVWMNWLTDPAYNTNDSIKAGYYDTRVLSRGDIHLPTGTGGGPTTPPTGGTGGTSGQITGLGGKCIDVAAASSANGTAVQLFTCNGTAAQTWTNNVSRDGTLRALGKCMDVASAGTANGTKVQLYDCNGTTAQKWSYSSGRLINAGSGRCLDATGQSSADATRLQIWDCTANANQQWTLGG